VIIGPKVAGGSSHSAPAAAASLTAGGSVSPQTAAGSNRQIINNSIPQNRTCFIPIAPFLIYHLY
jgi:hypothetical protein